MKPIYLKMQAFGPFAGAQSITFSDLGDSPLFLINGPTGSGKTTVLDAICYALYGSTTGNERDAKDMRCQQSDADLLTEITFDFRLAGNSYRIIRSPDQERPKKTGSGFTTHKTRADLYKLGPDGETQSGELLVEKKVSEASEYIKDITGLNAEQFRQVMVLPQGQFRKLLLADSKDKQKIFQSLFQTSVYSRIEDQLKEDSKEVRDAVGHAQSVIRSILEQGGADSEQDLEQKIELALPELASLDSAKEKAQTAWLAAERTLHDASKLKESFEAFDKVKNRETELQGQAAQRELDRTQALHAHAAQRIMPVFGRISEAEQALGNTNQEVSAAESVLAGAEQARAVAEAGYATEKSRHEERAATVAKVHELNSYAGKAEQLAAAKAAQDAALASETRQQSKRDESVQALEAHLSGETDIQQQLESLQKSISSAEGIDLKVHKLTAAVRSRKQLATLEANLGDAEQGLGKAVQLFAAAESAKGSADTTLKRLRKTWHQGQAALLAQELEEGNACPVCGSADHPAPALESVQIVSDDQLEEAATALDLDTSQVMVASGHVTACEQRVGSIKTEIKQCIDNLGDQAQQSVAAIEANFREASAVAGQLLVDQNRIKALQQTLKSHAEKTIALRQAVDAAQAAIAGAQKELGESQARFVLSENALPKPYRAVGKLEQELAAAIEAQAKLENSLDQAQTGFQQADKARAEAQVSIKELQRNKTKNEQLLSSVKSNWAQELTASVFNTEQEVQRAAMAQQDLEALDETLAKYAAEVLENKATGETLGKQLKGKVLADLPGLKEVEEAAISGRDETLEAWRAADRTMTRLYDTRKSLKSKQAEMADLDAKYRVVGTLADVACGLKGSKVSLQRYILGVLLDDVLVQSTQRLLKMSDGRYELRRKLDQGKGNKASGLDLEVYDDYSGESRSVATLSGGESFMAALSLALGLSDVVQAQTGGIALDTLFVDEGFGTLDSEALELAVSTLMDLQQAGRMVGIISHVSELKEQMDIRIDLSKSSQGVSSLKVVSPMLGGSG